MTYAYITTLLLLITIPASTLAQTAHSGYRVLTHNKQGILILDKQGKTEWEMPWGGLHDLHMLDNGNILTVQDFHKVVEIDSKTKKAVWEYDAAKANGNEGKRLEIHAIQPLKDGNLMIAESGIGRIIEINRDGKLLRETKLKLNNPHPHTDTRLVRKTAQGTYLVCNEGDGYLREYDSASGKLVWEYEVPLFGKKQAGGHGPEAWGNKLFCAVRLKNGNALIATGNGHGLIEVTPKKEIVWQIHQNDLPGITLAWVTTLEVLPNGNYVFGNCHAGPDQPILIEIEPKSKKVIWKFDQFAQLGNNVSNSQLLGIKGGTIR